MSMAKYIDSIGREHYCNEKIVDLSKEMAEIRIHGYAMHDHINKLMAASGKDIDLSESKIKLDEVINYILYTYNNYIVNLP